MTLASGAFRPPRLIALAELAVAVLLVVAHWSFFVEHRLFDQLLNFAENYAFVLNAGESRYFLATAITGLPVALLLVDASLRIWAPTQDSLFIRLSSRPRLAALLFALAGIALAECCACLFTHAQFTDDERIYLWQAQNFLHGSFTADRPEPVEFFHRFFMFMLRAPDGRWGSVYPPGQPALIALGLLLHAPHLPQLIMVGLTIWTASRLADELWGAETAVLAAALLATSPLLVLIGATLHNAVPTTLFALVALRSAFRYRAAGERRQVVFAGCAVGAALTCRPFDAVLLSAPLALLITLQVLRPNSLGVRWQARLLDLLSGALAAAPFVAFLLAWQRAVTGNALLAPYSVFMQRWPEAHAFGFGPSAFGVDHTLPLALSKAIVIWARFDAWLFGWPLATVPLLLVVIGLRRDPKAIWLLAVIGLHCAGYFFYAAPSVHTFGTYYQLPLAPLVALLTARAALGLREILGVHGEAASEVPLRALGALTIASVCLFWLPQLTHLWRIAARIRAPLLAAETAAQQGPILVFHRAMQPTAEPRFTSWTIWPPLTRADFSDRVIWASDYGSHNLELIQRIPDHRPFLLVWPLAASEPVLVPWSIELVPPSKRVARDFKRSTNVDESRLGAILAQPNQMVLPERLGWTSYERALRANKEPCKDASPAAE